jgi:hypothetical protein
VQDEALQE